MLPKIWIFDTYSIMLFIGVLLCLLLYRHYAKSNNINSKYTYDILLLGCISVFTGLIFASLFQLLFDLLKENSTNQLFSMTFYGGLVGGVICFLLGYFLIIKKRYKEANFSNDILTIAPACITLAHGIGRIGCFLAGCCYGIETDSFLGVKFPHLDHNVYPTQLYEAFFLLLLTFVLYILAMKLHCKYNLCIYLFSYGVFRFLLEFIRGDDRGAFFLSLSPSQLFSIIAIIVSIGLFIYLKFIKE